MARPKPQSHTEAKSAPAVKPKDATPRWKVLLALGMLGACLLVLFLFTSGVMKDLFAGPKIPLPRQVAQVSLGQTLEDLQARFTGLKKLLRPYNNDPDFKIATLTTANGLTGATKADFIFFHNQLYFISAEWDGTNSQAIPYEDWTRQFRRWNKLSHPQDEKLNDQVKLKEWHFADGSTEMTLMHLDYPGNNQLLQQLRDSTNSPAQAAFAKYRLETDG